MKANHTHNYADIDSYFLPGPLAPLRVLNISLYAIFKAIAVAVPPSIYRILSTALSNWLLSEKYLENGMRMLGESENDITETRVWSRPSL